MTPYERRLESDSSAACKHLTAALEYSWPNHSADKILNGLEKIEHTASVGNSRWAWELVQNARDAAISAGRGVQLNIRLERDTFHFEHNAGTFSADDLVGVHFQISSKERAVDKPTEEIGQFGTGFLTTHILSRRVTVSGVLNTGESLSSFTTCLDRRGQRRQDLVQRLEQSWSELRSSLQELDGREGATHLTKFLYHLDGTRQQEFARAGLNDLINLLPYVMAFSRSIEKVELHDAERGTHISLTRGQASVLRNGVSILPIAVIEKGVESRRHLAIRQEEHLGFSIAVPVSVEEDGLLVCQSLTGVPRLFCDFPLKGTESLPFPAVLNSTTFFPTEERDGVWLGATRSAKVQHNQKLIEDAVGSFTLLFAALESANARDLFQLVDTHQAVARAGYLDASWHADGVQKPLKRFLAAQRVVETAAGGLAVIGAEEARALRVPRALFPDGGTAAQRLEIWKFVADIFPSHAVRQDHVEAWSSRMWEDCFLMNQETLALNVAEHHSVKHLGERLCKTELETLQWLGDFVQFIDRRDKQLFNEQALFPNQYGDFHRYAELSLDGVADEILFEVASLLDLDVRSKLFHPGINSFLARDNLNLTRPGPPSVLTLDEFSRRIERQFGETSHANPRYQRAVYLLCGWFDAHPEEAQRYFPTMYRDRAKLFMDTVEDKSSLYRIMRSGVNLVQLAAIAESSRQGLLPLDGSRATVSPGNVLAFAPVARGHHDEPVERQETPEHLETARMIERHLEQLLRAALHGHYEVRRTHEGRDIVLTPALGGPTFDIEIKSTLGGDRVELSHAQVEHAVNRPGHFSLCVVPYVAPPVSAEWVWENARIVIEFGAQISDLHRKVTTLRSSSSKVESQDGRFHAVLNQPRDVFYSVHEDVWKEGISLAEFRRYLLQLPGLNL